MVVEKLNRADVERRVLQALRELLNDLGGGRALAAVELDASIEKDLGLGSLERVELLSRVESAFGVELPESVLAEAETPADLVQSVLSVEAPIAKARAEAVTPVLASPSFSVEAETLPEVLRLRAEAEPQRAHIHLQSEGGRDEVIRYGELHGQAREVAGGLVERGVHRGDTVALMLPTSRDFFTAFAGILLAGGVPAPLYPPFSLDKIGEYVGRQADILLNSQANILITVERGRSVGHVLRRRVPNMSHVTTVEELRSSTTAAPALSVDPTAPALIQYTSGSTGDPKGALLSHWNLLSNIRAIGEALDLKPTDVGVSWLPLYHDMGLIGCWLTPLVFGFPITIMSPLTFLSRPELWLWAIHSRRATLSAAPNFGYELCVRKIREEALEGLDLSSWRGALNGAEPVSADTVDRFSRRFAAYGFRPQIMTPVYGLAESSLALSIPPIGRGPRIERISRDPFENERRATPASDNDKTALRFISAGPPLPGCELRVVDEQGKELPERVEGALHFRGPSTMKGYFRNREATESISKPGGWLDSGDRAFVVEGEYFITGRAKDIIIRAGRNLYPPAIEEVVADVEGVRRGCVVAFGVSDPRLGTEKVVVVAEARVEGDDAKKQLALTIQQRLTESLGIGADDVLVVPPRTVPKTSSGKLRRSSCRSQYLRGELSRKQRGNRLLVSQMALHVAALSIRRGLAALGRFVYGAYVLFVAAALFLPVWALSWLVPRHLFSRLSRIGIRLFLFLAGYRLRVSGLEHLEAGVEAPFVLVSNHASYIDPLPLLAGLPLDFAFVVKSDAMTWPLMGRLIERLGHLSVERGDRKSSVRDAEKLGDAMRGGRSIFFFPEGTFTRAMGLRPFKLGAFKLAAESGRAIVPIALVGTRRFLRDESWLPRASELAIVVEAPLLARDASLAEMVRLRDQAAEQIARHVGEPRLDLVSAGLPLS